MLSASSSETPSTRVQMGARYACCWPHPGETAPPPLQQRSMPMKRHDATHATTMSQSHVDLLLGYADVRKRVPLGSHVGARRRPHHQDFYRHCRLCLLLLLRPDLRALQRKSLPLQCSERMSLLCPLRLPPWYCCYYCCRYGERVCSHSGQAGQDVPSRSPHLLYLTTRTCGRYL